MYVTQINKRIQAEYEARLKKTGEEGLYRHILGQAIINKGDMIHPEIIIMDHADAFFAAFRRTGNENFFTIGRILRRAAHRLFRELRRMNKDYPNNSRFLRLVK